MKKSDRIVAARVIKNARNAMRADGVPVSLRNALAVETAAHCLARAGIALELRNARERISELEFELEIAKWG